MKMSKSFFKNLLVVENLVKSEEPTLLLSDGTYTYYSEDAKNLVIDISNWLLACNFTKSKTSIFICQNYTKDCETITNIWNRTHTKHKSQKTFSSQISTLSSHLYKMLGTNCFDVIIADNKEGMNEVRLRLNLFTEDITFTDYPIEMFQYYVSDNYSGKEYSLEECSNEIEMLKTLRRSALSEYMEKADSDNLSYLKTVLNTPLLNQHTKKVNEKKLELIKRLDTINGLSYADIVVNYIQDKENEKQDKDDNFEQKVYETFGVSSDEIKKLLSSIDSNNSNDNIENKYHMSEQELEKLIAYKSNEVQLLEKYNFMPITEYVKTIGTYKNEKHNADNLSNDKYAFADEIKALDKTYFENILSKYTSDAVIEGLHELRKKE